MYNLDLEKAEEPEIKLSSFAETKKKQRNSKTTSSFASLTMLKLLTVDHNKLWNILEEMGKPDHLTCLLISLYTGQEATVRSGHETMDWFKIGKGVHQGCVLSPYLFDLYAEYIVRSAGLGEAQAGIKIARRNITTSDM